MPELPEMETYRRLLADRLANRQITHVEVNREKTVGVPANVFSQTVSEQRVVDVTRRAKHILFWLDSGYVLLLHLMLGGWMYYGSPTDQPKHRSQVVLSFGPDQLFFVGLRLGYLRVFTKHAVETELCRLGPDPLDPSFTARDFQQRLQVRRDILKSTLVDQKFLSGVGNRYSDEICFDAGILPLSRIGQLGDKSLERLHGSMQQVLNEAIAYGGYMEHPFFHGDQHTGRYNERCRVYNRGGQPCPRCGHPITKTVNSGRKVFYCEGCQHGQG